jgi:hypothetical protein
LVVCSIRVCGVSAVRATCVGGVGSVGVGGVGRVGRVGGVGSIPVIVSRISRDILSNLKEREVNVLKLTTPYCQSYCVVASICIGSWPTPETIG